MSNSVKINIALGFIACFLIYVTCKSKGLQSPTLTPTPTPTLTPNSPTIPIASVPAPTASRRSYLATGFWHVKHAVSFTDTTVYRYINPKILKFRENQTFDIYLDNKVLTSGDWAFNEEKMELYLSCKDQFLNNSWRIKESGFTMLLLGNTDLNKSGIQIQMFSRPDLNRK
jgi:hypothetical protein